MNGLHNTTTLAALLIASGMMAVSDAGTAQAQDERSAIQTREEVEAAIAELEDEKTRLAALERLIPFATLRIFQVGSVVSAAGDCEKDVLIRKAAEAVARYHDFETLSKAVNSSSEMLQYWALFNLPVPPYDDSDDPWESLLPRLRKLYTSGNSGIRLLAQNRLSHFAGQREFLAERLWEETSLSNVMRLSNHLDHSTYREGMNSHVLRFLNHDEKVLRLEALSFVARNTARARMWRVDFNDEVLAKVLELSHSANGGERSSAVSALTDLRKNYRLRKKDSDTVRERILELADDPSASVRWQVSVGMRDDDLEHPEVQAVLARLLKDESPLVRYFTIVKLGPEKHIDELRELASGPDKQVAEFAAQKLNELERKKP